MIKENQIKILMLMHELEKSLGNLYETFAAQFPEHNDLWQRLIHDEHVHAESIRKFYQLTYKGQTLFEEGELKYEAVNSIVTYIQGAVEKAKRMKFTAKQALTLTNDLENSLLEREIFKHFKASTEFVNVLHTLDKETRQHAQLSKDEIAKVSNHK